MGGAGQRRPAVRAGDAYDRDGPDRHHRDHRGRGGRRRRPADCGGAAPGLEHHDTPDFSHGRWQRHELLPAADGLTDVAYWDVGWWVAGYRALQPVVYDFDEGEGASLPVPDTRLDPRHPAVLVADIPVAGPMVLATQSKDGPTVWVGEGSDWSRVPAPPGRLLGAERVGAGVYLLVEGNLWFRELPGLESRVVA